VPGIVGNIPDKMVLDKVSGKGHAEEGSKLLARGGQKSRLRTIKSLGSDVGGLGVVCRGRVG